MAQLNSLLLPDYGGGYIDILNIIYPIGSIYISTINKNPFELFGIGEWEIFGQGKTLVGVDENDSTFSSVETTGGEKTHTLTVSEMPSHTHDIVNQNHTTQGLVAATGTVDAGNWSFVDSATDNFYGAKFIAKAVGDSQAHNNLQPYITVYMWKRVL